MLIAKDEAAADIARALRIRASADEEILQVKDENKKVCTSCTPLRHR
jgi:hypothetical protein